MDNIVGLLDAAETRGVALWVEDGQLRFRAAVGAMSEDLRAGLRLHKQALIRALAGRPIIRREPASPSKGTSRPTFRPLPQPERLPILSYHHIRWNSIRTGELGPEFTNAPHAEFRWLGEFDVTLLQRCVDILRSRHPILRARVVDTAEGPQFLFGADESVAVQQYHAADATAATRLATELTWRPFAAQDEPWLRVYVIRISEQEHLIGSVLHHFIGDGWSIDLLCREMLGLYSALEAGSTPELPSPPLQYAEYVSGVNEWLACGGARVHADYWREHLRGAPPTHIPFDRVASPDESGPVLTATFEVPIETVNRLRNLAKAHGVGLHAMVVAAVTAALAMQSRQNDVVIVSRVSGRVYPEVQSMIGAFFDAIAVRVQVDPEQSIFELVKSVQATLVRSYEHQVYPFQLVKSALAEDGASDIAPMMNFIDNHVESRDTSGGNGRLAPVQLLPRPVENHSCRRYTSFYLAIATGDKGMRGRLDYLPLQHDTKTITSFMQTICRLLESIATQPGNRLRSVLEARQPAGLPGPAASSRLSTMASSRPSGAW